MHNAPLSSLFPEVILYKKPSIELEVARGNLIPLELVVETWQGHIGNARAKLLALPPKAAAQSIGMDDYLESE